MNFDDTPEEAVFRERVRAFLNANAEKRRAGQVYGVNYGEHSLLPLSAAWQLKKFEAGFSGITIPKAYGGQGGTRMQEAIYAQEEVGFLTPRHIGSGPTMVLPTLLAWASEEQKERYIPPILRGEELWCQLFSEPSGGSDLAGLRTRAERDGEGWIINGQKIWTSNAHHAKYGILIARSDPSVPKHKGLTFFFIDMDTPGILVRGIKQIAGYSNFNEVFFNDVRVPDSRRLGKTGEGWRVTITTLMNERVVAGIRPRPDFDEIYTLAQQTVLESGRAIQNTAVREKLAKWYVQSRGVTYTRLRILTALSRGEQPGPENSITKLVSGFKRQEISHYGIDLLDSAGLMNNPNTAPLRGMFQRGLLDSPSDRVGAGTDEILRNVIAERVLGLPQDIRIDKNIAFNAIENKTP
ncbi:MAG: acyl-CoA dehydrogenase family protein [Alphaproteobacteria bacterium]|jgi:alkylation response protein AidB-like acyl-CoA dehydrogenase